MKLILNLLGIIIVLAICWLISWDRKNIKWKTILKALVTEIIIAIIIVKIPVGQKIITVMSNGLTAVINCGNEGLSFVFGDLFNGEISVFIIQSLGNIIFVSALVGVLYYLGVIGFVVKWIGKGVGKVMGTTEVESFVAVANMFLGHTDSPILVSKYLKDLTDSEITALRKEIDKYDVEGDLRRDVQMSIKNKMEINCYQGIRHKKGLPVRGQRTSRNARTRKGKGKVVANKKKVGK